jgi:uncharacterized protein with GYD domain
MPIFISQGRYTREAVKGMTANPEDRTEEVKKLLAAVGATFHALYFTFGEYDFLLIAEAPNEKSMAAALIAVAGGGGVTDLKTTIALAAAEMKDAFMAAKPIAAYFRSAGGVS